MPSSFKMTRRVVFSETDAAGIAHFANFFRWMEDAEHAFLRSLGTSVHQQDSSGLRGFARVGASCEYQSPLKFEDEFAVVLSVLEKKAKSLTYGFSFEVSGVDKPIATGEMTVVCITRPNDADRMRATDIPADLADLITVKS